MKTFAKRFTALALALVLAAGALGQTAFASWALGEELVDRTVELAEGVSWTVQKLWSASKSDLRTENYITYAPGSGVTPMVYSGTYVASLNTAAAAAEALEEQGFRVIAGINGGFFNGNGTAVGILMTEGTVRALDLHNWTMLGFTRDGRVFIDESLLTKTVSWETQDASKRHLLVGFNAHRSNDDAGGLYLYNQDFSSKVGQNASRGCVAVVLAPVSGGGVTINGTLTLSVEEIMDTRAGDTYNGVLADGRYMLYATYYDGNEALTSDLRSLTPGQQVTVTVSGGSEQWADAAYGISGLYTLLREGEIVPEPSDTANPRTAVGLKADGTAVFYTIDGRRSGYSVGASYAQVAERLQELGCVTAVALDGGGSTALGATLPGQQSFKLLNRPSESNRELSNFIFLVAGDGYAGMDRGFYLSSDTQVVFQGASLNVSAAGYDKWGNAASGITPRWSATGGTIAGDGLSAVYTAGNTAGIYAIRAGSGSELSVRVIDKLSRLTVLGENGASVSSLLLQFRDTVDLSVSGRWWNLDVALEDENVTWAVSGDIGTIDAQGRFTAGSKKASGEITASAGGRTATVKVAVETDCPFDDIEEHWSMDYVVRLYDLGLTNGYVQEDGTAIYQPDAELTRGELLAFITRLLHVDTVEFEDVTLPFADEDTIPEWILPSVKAMYMLGVLNGSESDGMLYANVNNCVSREEAMTLLGRVLADRVSWDLSGFADSDAVSDWALSYVETLVGLNVVHGSDGMLTPQLDITRGEAAKLLVEINGLEKAELTPRPFEPEGDDPETQEPDDPGETPDDPEQPGEDMGDPAFPDDPGETPDDPGQPGEDTGDPAFPDDSGETPGDPEQPGESTGDPAFPDDSGKTPDNPDQSGEDTGDPDFPDDPAFEPQD